MKVLQHLLFLSLAAAFASVPGFAQDDKYGTTEEQRINCKEALSVYKSYKKQEELRRGLHPVEKGLCRLS